MDALRLHFRPELINRIDEIVIFKRLGKAALDKITRNMVTDALARIHEAGFPLTVDESVISHLSEIGSSEEYGAREVRRTVLHHLEDRFSLAVIEGEISQGVPYRAILQSGEIVFVADIPTPVK